MPDAQVTSNFLLQGGAFALVCIMIIAGLVGAWYGGRSLFKLLKEFLAAMQLHLETQTAQLGAANVILAKISDSTTTTATTIGEWSNPDWLKKRLDFLESQATKTLEQITEVRIHLGVMNSKKGGGDGAPSA
jgi:hypothetical protein